MNPIFWFRSLAFVASISVFLWIFWYARSTYRENVALRIDLETSTALAKEREMQNEKRIAESQQQAKTAIEDLDKSRVARADLDRRLRTIATSNSPPITPIIASASAPIADAGQGQCLQDLDRLGRAAARVAVSLSDALAVSAERDAYTRQLTDGWPQ